MFFRIFLVHTAYSEVPHKRVTFFLFFFGKFFHLHGLIWNQTLQNFLRTVSRDQRIDQSATSIQSLLNTNGATFLMTSHVRSGLSTLPENKTKNETIKKYSIIMIQYLFCSDFMQGLKSNVFQNRQF